MGCQKALPAKIGSRIRLADLGVTNVVMKPFRPKSPSWESLGVHV